MMWAPSPWSILPARARTAAAWSPPASLVTMSTRKCFASCNGSDSCGIGPSSNRAPASAASAMRAGPPPRRVSVSNTFLTPCHKQPQANPSNRPPGPTAFWPGARESRESRVHPAGCHCNFVETEWLIGGSDMANASGDTTNGSPKVSCPDTTAAPRLATPPHHVRLSNSEPLPPTLRPTAGNATAMRHPPATGGRTDHPPGQTRQ